MTQLGLLPGLPLPKVDEDGRRTNDCYETPFPLARAICRRLDRELGRPERVIEPHAGSGNFIRAARTVWPSVRTLAVELDEAFRPALLSCSDAVRIGDWLEESKKLAGVYMRGPRLFLGNPPFSSAVAQIEATRAVMEPGEYLAQVLRMSFLGGQERAANFWPKARPRFVIPIAERPDFTNEGGDNSEYGVFVWQAGYTGRPELLDHIWEREFGKEAA